MAGLRKIREDPTYFENLDKRKELHGLEDIEFEIDKSFLENKSADTTVDSHAEVITGSEKEKDSEAVGNNFKREESSSTVANDAEDTAKLAKDAENENASGHQEGSISNTKGNFATETHGEHEHPSTAKEDDNADNTEGHEEPIGRNKAVESTHQEEQEAQIPAPPTRSTEDPSEGLEPPVPPTAASLKGAATRAWKMKLTEKDLLEKVGF
ncbi:unnamed protein product [Strongylus vulgaris]|uniref:Uncharacterized protein n=1 Tax=Strongylus vulgaris TaxID=40348 RepID=A0A3P7IR32_STRVU|nr:unnamed protein product [Strongylus vulgaris]